MNIIEIELERMQKRLRKLEESLENNPDPRKLKTNKLLYRLDVEERQAQLEAYRNGKVFGVIGGLLGQVMGFTPSGGINPVPSVAQDDAMKWFDDVRSRGQVGDACDMSIIVYAQREHMDIPRGHFNVVAPLPCTVQYLAALQRSYNQKDFIYYYMDVGFEENEATLEHATNQLRELVELVQKLYPGYKLDEARLAELQAYEEEALKYYKDIYEMQKHKPAPMGGRDAFWQTSPTVPGMWPDPRRAVEYAKARRDEVAERLEEKVYAVPEEKARVIWTVTRPFFMDNFKPLEKWNIVVPFFYAGPAQIRTTMPQRKFWGNRQLAPLEKEALRQLLHLWSGSGDKWIDPLIWICRDLKIDGIVNYCQRGATCTLGLKRLVEEKAEKELDIPTLQLEGAQWDTNFADEATINNKLEEFAQILLERKKLN